MTQTEPKTAQRTAGELRARFPYLAEAKIENIIGHLRERGLLAWDSETSRYGLSPPGRMVISALAVLFRLGDEGSELGYIAGQLAASSVSGRVSEEDLQHLLSRLTELKDEFERAILSGSESRIRAAEAKFKFAMRWVDKGSEVLERILQEVGSRAKSAARARASAPNLWIGKLTK